MALPKWHCPNGTAQMALPKWHCYSPYSASYISLRLFVTCTPRRGALSITCEIRRSWLASCSIMHPSRARAEARMSALLEQQQQAQSIQPPFLPAIVQRSNEKPARIEDLWFDKAGTYISIHRQQINPKFHHPLSHPSSAHSISSHPHPQTCYAKAGSSQPSSSYSAHPLYQQP